MNDREPGDTAKVGGGGGAILSVTVIVAGEPCTPAELMVMCPV